MIRYNLYGILSVFIISLPKFFSAATFEREEPNTAQIEASILPYSASINFSDVAAKNSSLNVSASVYYPEEAQTDSSPFITADGSKINQKKPRNHRWIAVSRNLLRKWGGTIDYGDTLKVEGVSRQLDGLYVVHDTMKRRIKNRVDILVGENDEIMGFWDNVKVYNLN